MRQTGLVSELVTGDAVVLELRLAKLPSRGLAFLLDFAVQVVVLVALFVLTARGVLAVDERLGAVIALLVVVATMVGYPVLFETLSRGRTLGKLALGLRVVREDGGPIRFRHALTRGLAGFFVDFWGLGLGGVVAVVVSLSSAKGKRVGDYLAGTVVVRERVSAREVTPPAMPPQLAPWAAGLDLSRLPDDLVLAVRQYLVRYHELNAATRDSMGHRLAADLAAWLGQPPPPGVPAWAYLSAVLAERRARAERAHPGWPSPGPPATRFPAPGTPPPTWVPAPGTPPPTWAPAPGTPPAADPDTPFTPPS